MLKPNQISKFIKQVKIALTEYPVELLLISIFSLFFLIAPISDWNKQEYFSYWLFYPLYFTISYLCRHHRLLYWISSLTPIIGSLVIWQLDYGTEFYIGNNKYAVTLLICFILLCTTPFEKQNIKFIQRTFSSLLNSAFAFSLSGLILLILFIIRFSIEALFNLQFAYQTEKYLLGFSFSFFTPLFFLIFQYYQNKILFLNNRLFGLVINFILSPALVVYTLILYVYVAQIILFGELPKGILAYLIIPYLCYGLALYCLQVICEPQRWKTFYRYYPYLILIPCSLLWMAIIQRVDNYSWTESRIYLAAIASALSVSYGLLLFPQLRQYRNLAILMIISILSITFVINPEKMAWQSQTQRFEKLLVKLNLLDSQGKIREDFVPANELKNLSEQEFNDYNELQEIATYLYYKQHILKKYNSPKDKNAYPLITRYGKQIETIQTLVFDRNDRSIYLEELAIAIEQVSVMTYNRKTVPLNINGYNSLIKWDSSSEFHNSAIYSKEQTYQSKTYCYEYNNKKLACFNFDQIIADIFSKNGLDIHMTYSLEVLEKLEDQFLTMKDPNTGALAVFDQFTIRHYEDRYIFERAKNLTLLIK